MSEQEGKLDELNGTCRTLQQSLEGKEEEKNVLQGQKEGIEGKVLELEKAIEGLQEKKEGIEGKELELEKVIKGLQEQKEGKEGKVLELDKVIEGLQEQKEEMLAKKKEMENIIEDATRKGCEVQERMANELNCPLTVGLFSATAKRSIKMN